MGKVIKSIKSQFFSIYDFMPVAIKSYVNGMPKVKVQQHIKVYNVVNEFPAEFSKPRGMNYFPSYVNV